MTALLPADVATVSDEFADDIQLADDIVGFTASRQPAREVLLTGATGFLGAFLLRELLARGMVVHCLVRAKDNEAAQQRIVDTITALDLLDSIDLDRVRVVTGDLTEPGLGMTDEDYARTTEQIDAVYHSAAKVNFLTPYKWLRKSTVVGMHEVLRLVCRAKVPLHHVSTTGVFAAIQNDTAKHECDVTGPPEDFPLGYTKSKWVAEQLVLEARRRGVPVTMHRPGQIWGDTRTGACQNNDFVWRFIKGSIQAGLYPRNFRLSMNLVPVDYVCAAMVAVATNPDAMGGVYHEISPAETNSEKILGLIRSAGYEMKEVSIIKWLKAIAADVNNSMFPLMRTTMEMEKVETAEFADKLTQEFLDGTGVVCPDLDETAFATYVAYFVRNGNLPSPR